MLDRPTFSDVYGLRFYIMGSIGDVLAEKPTMFSAFVFNNTYFVVAKTVAVTLL